MNKDEFRSLFLEAKKYIKFFPILKELNIPQANFSHFLKGWDYAMSYEKLYALYNAIQDRVSKFA